MQFVAERADTVSAPSESVARFKGQERRLATWMKAAQAGDGDAYENALRASIPFIQMIVRRQGVPVDLVDDAVQETLIAVHRNWQTYDSVRPYTAWLRTIAQRRAIDVIRSQVRISTRELYEPIAFENHADLAETPEEHANRIDRKSVVKSAIVALPKRQRQAIEQLVLKGKSLVDAAVAIGLTPGALKVNFHRALKTLREQFGVQKNISDCDSHKRPARFAATSGKIFTDFEHAVVKFEM